MESFGYNFKNEKFLQTALTHSSYGNERHCVCNERMEFLGDAVLSIIVSDYLFSHMPHDNEGKLSKIRASLVCEQSLAKLAGEIGLGNKIKLGKGEELTGGRQRASILSDAFEAVLAAIYLDSGMEDARKWLLELMSEDLKLAVTGKTYHDYKTMLQEEIQKSGGAVTYKVISESGPDHHKDFTVELCINNKRITTADGSSKKDAEQNAAKKALEKLN